MADIKALATHLDDASRNATEIPQLTEPISLADAYDIQKQSMAHRFSRGEKQVGIKMGFTSRAKMVQIPVNYHPRVGQSSVTGDLSKTISLGMEMIGLVIKTRLNWARSRPGTRPSRGRWWRRSTGRPGAARSRAG